MNKARISYLHQEYLNQTITAEEWAEFKEVLNNVDCEQILFDLLDRKWEKIAAADIERLNPARFERVFRHIVSLEAPYKKILKLRQRFTVAASIGLVICSLVFFYNRHHSTPRVQYTTDIRPGHYGGTLTLSNGKMIKLTATTVGRLASEKGIVISKSADGKLVYQSNSNEKSLARLSNTLTTGCAENVKVILPDRSAVWLNAGSSLSYPTSFAGEKTRVVNLNGEAYFEVEKDRTHPFIVKTNRQSVEVLGTHFDINAYENEASVKTTLIEGSVQVMPLIKNTNVKGTSSSAILQPKQQAILTNGSLQVENADLEEALAWINGKFVFRDESLTKIMSQVAQWYDINVKYENDVSDLTYWGSVSRTANLSSVLAYLSKTGNVSFKIQGKLVVVKKTSKK